MRKKKMKAWEKNEKKQRKKYKLAKKLKAAIRRKKKAKLEEDETISDDDPLNHIDYDNLHLAFDQEKDHKFSF